MRYFVCFFNEVMVLINSFLSLFSSQYCILSKPRCLALQKKIVLHLHCFVLFIFPHPCNLFTCLCMLCPCECRVLHISRSLSFQGAHWIQSEIISYKLALSRKTCIDMNLWDKTVVLLQAFLMTRINILVTLFTFFPPQYQSIKC